MKQSHKKTSLLRLSPTLLVKLITNAYIHKKGVFGKRVNAEDHIPAKTTQKQKALFLFYTIQLDYATRSQQLYAGARKLWQEARKYFLPEVIAGEEEKSLLQILQTYLKPRYINEAVTRWQSNSQLLISDYTGNPLEIFHPPHDAQQIIRRIYAFRGFGPKIGNFFLRTMVNTFSLTLEHIDQIAQPVDTHDIRLSFEWGFVKNARKDMKNIARVKHVWQKACQDANISWLTFDKALWILGSEGKRSDDPVQDLAENLGITRSELVGND